MARPWVGIEEQPPICRVAADILNNQSRTVDKGFGRGADQVSHSHQTTGKIIVLQFIFLDSNLEDKRS
jgi:hypothetical protein